MHTNTHTHIYRVVAKQNQLFTHVYIYFNTFIVCTARDDDDDSGTIHGRQGYVDVVVVVVCAI